MLPITALDSALATLGVTAGSKVVIYFGSDWVSPTTRAWLTMEYAGLGDRAVILDGGIARMEGSGLRGDRRGPGGTERHAARDDG